MPSCISRFWIFFVFWLSCFRIGEAAVPGPAPHVPSDIVQPDWFFPAKPDFSIGIGNPSGISNKFHLLDGFPIGWWHFAETQASKYQQCCLQGKLAAISRSQQRCIRSIMGAPAPLRPGSQFAGSWTGVLSFGDCPLRDIPCPWPNGEFSTGRVSLSMAFLYGLEITAATVYLPPRGPTFPHARHLSEMLLQGISEEIVCGRQGPRIILGDFNCQAGELEAMRFWSSCGFVELQDWFSRAHGFVPRHTCKSATTPDQIWISAELLPYVSNVGTWSIFPDHDMLVLGLSLSCPPAFEYQWRLPGRIPWDKIDLDRWHANSTSTSVKDLFLSVQAQSLDFDDTKSLACQSTSLSKSGVPASRPSVVGSSLESTDSQGTTSPNDFAISDDNPTQAWISEAFARWSSNFEEQVSQSFGPTVTVHDRSFHGRGQLLKPSRRRVVPVVPRHSRQGEEVQACGFLNRSVCRWYQQVRRLQSYRHAAHSSRASETFSSRAALWQSIRRAPGFVNGFCSWWPTRLVQYQGSPLAIPEYPPDSECIDLIYEDFLVNYRRYEHWQLTKRKQCLQSKIASSAKDMFLLTRKPPKASLDCLEDKITQTIEVIDTGRNIVSVAQPFPSLSVHRWTLQDQPVIVRPLAQGYQVEGDLVLCSGQDLTCHITISDADQIHLKLEQLWSPYWNRHGQTPVDRWEEIIDFGVSHLPTGMFKLPPLTRSDWHQAIHRFKPSAAAGPCGWTRSDLYHFTPSHVDQILEMYSMIEAGVPWPIQCATGLIHCLQKKSDRFSVEGFRPITVTSMLFRLYAGIRAGQLLFQIAQLTGHFQCGFAPNKKAADVWYFVNICVEMSLQSSQPIHGYVADLVKAYNTLPRHPVFRLLAHCGVPPWFLNMWSRYLRDFQRFFVVRRATSFAQYSCTGFPEGCPLSCVAMTCIDWLWHSWQATRVPRALAISYVDNLESLTHEIDHLNSSWISLVEFCRCLDLFVDLPQLYAWSTSTLGRRELRTLGFKVSFGERDLGGQVCYGAGLRNKVLTDRISAILPFFDSIRRSNTSLVIKVANIFQVLWPRALHGCEAVTLGAQHFTKLRSGAMKSLRWNRGGASPIIRLSLLNTDKLDPEWFDLWHSVKLFRQQCNSLPMIRDWWSVYVRTGHRSTHGPFGKLWKLFESLDVKVDEHFRLWFSDGGWINLLLAPISEVMVILQHAYWDRASCLVNQRAGFEDLCGFDCALTTVADDERLASDTELLNIVRDGSFITNNFKGRFDTTKSSFCELCGALDTRQHRYESCPRYNHIREAHASLFQIWPSLPASFRFYGLCGRNPWRKILWEAFAALPSQTSVFSVQPRGWIRHVFTDGTCSDPQDSDQSLAAWAAVWADGEIVVSSGVVPGITQTILRAELLAVISTLQWGSKSPGELHIWCDNETVVTHMRALQQQVDGPDSFSHPDLWWEVDSLLRGSLAEVYIHKVASHLSEEDQDSPLSNWCSKWNGIVDSQAARANTVRPPWFCKIWESFQLYRRQWQEYGKLVQSFHLDVAKQDCTDVEAAAVEEVDFSTELVFEWFDNDLSFSNQIESASAEFVFSAPHFGSLYPTLYSDFTAWIVAIDQEAARTRLVSFLELFVAFRLLFCEGKTVRQLAGLDGIFSEATFAADFSFFKKMIVSLLRDTFGHGGEGHIDLSFLGIHMPLVAVYCGWPADVEVQSMTALKAFINNRPAKSAQAFAKPWRL